MRVFTKITKVPFSKLRQEGHISVVYVDDSYLQGDTYQACMVNILDTVNLLRGLGFTIHAEKSVLIPHQKITFLGFVLNSVDMTITLTMEKKQKILNLCKYLLSADKETIRYIAKVIGNIVAFFPVVPFGKLFYRYLEREKTIALKKNQGNFDKLMSLSCSQLNALKYPRWT